MLNHLEVLLRVSLAEQHEDAKGQRQGAAQEAQAQAHVCEERGHPQVVPPKGCL